MSSSSPELYLPSRDLVQLPPTRRHGTISGYELCKCASCRDASRLYAKDLRGKHRAERWALHDPDLLVPYCRCPGCSAKRQVKKTRQLEAVPNPRSEVEAALANVSLEEKELADRFAATDRGVACQALREHNADGEGCVA